MSTQRPQTALGDELANLGIGLLIGAALFAMLLRGSGTVAAWASGTAQTNGGPETGLAVLLNPGNPAMALRAPGLNPVVYWVTTIVLVGLVSALAIGLRRMFRGVTTKVDPYRIAGIRGAVRQLLRWGERPSRGRTTSSGSGTTYLTIVAHGDQRRAGRGDDSQFSPNVKKRTCSEVLA
jgi:hypothetical protein